MKIEGLEGERGKVLAAVRKTVFIFILRGGLVKGFTKAVVSI